MADCPSKGEDKKDKKERFQRKKKAIIAAWGSSDDESTSDEEKEVANFCLMGIEDEPDEVPSSSTYVFKSHNVELEDAFEELYHEFL